MDGSQQESPVMTRRSTESHLFPNLIPSTPGSIDVHTPASPEHLVELSHPSPFDQIAPFPPQELWARDCELMHHYCNFTADTMSIRRDTAHVWKVIIPQQGYTYPWVMHGVLALSAAHKAYLMPENRRIYLPLADYHQTLGSQGYRSTLQNRQQETDRWMPIFSFASVVTLHMLALPSRMEDGRLQDPIENLVGLSKLTRGVRSTLRPILSGVVRTEFAPMIYGVWPYNFSTTSFDPNTHG